MSEIDHDRDTILLELAAAEDRVARVEALANEWDRRPGVGDYITLTEAVDDLRAALRGEA